MSWYWWILIACAISSAVVVLAATINAHIDIEEEWESRQF